MHDRTYQSGEQSFRSLLVQALASEKDESPKVVIAQMKREKQQKIIETKSRNIQQHNKKDPILQATSTYSNGQIYKCTNKNEMVAAMAKSNLSWQQHSATTPFMTEPLFSKFGYLTNKNVAQEVLNGTYIPPPNSSKYAV